MATNVRKFRIGEFRITDKHINEVQLIADSREVEHFSWLDDLSPSHAYIICVGAGPWKWRRRQKVQDAAIDHLNEKHGGCIEKVVGFSSFPFVWQNAFVNNLAKYLQDHNTTFVTLVEMLRTEYLGPKDFFKACGKEYGAKVLWLFLRDYAKIPAFPADRYVLRALKRHGLPTNSWAMMEICKKAGVNPSKVAKLLLIESGEFNYGTEL